MCIYGNVSPQMLTLGDPAEVKSHCEELIEDVGAGGGFIIGPACTMPTDAKPENVRAMTEAVLGKG
jgi:uroporphyrinogen-III decarboxylase